MRCLLLLILLVQPATAGEITWSYSIDCNWDLAEAVNLHQLQEISLHSVRLRQQIRAQVQVADNLRLVLALPLAKRWTRSSLTDMVSNTTEQHAERHVQLGPPQLQIATSATPRVGVQHNLFFGNDFLNRISFGLHSQRIEDPLLLSMQVSAAFGPDHLQAEMEVGYLLATNPRWGIGQSLRLRGNQLISSYTFTNHSSVRDWKLTIHHATKTNTIGFNLLWAWP